MKNVLSVTFALVLLAGVACAATNPLPASSSLPVAQSSTMTGTSGALRPNEGAPIPVCQPGHNCPPSVQQQLIANEGAPIPVCQPGHNCPPSVQQQLIANEGAPIPVCQPGHNCPPSFQQQLIANEGAPIPVCQPGHNCPPSLQQMIANEQMSVEVSL